jgi:two-component system heavy metal sensor histidine kinase CusS
MTLRTRLALSFAGAVTLALLLFCGTAVVVLVRGERGTEEAAEEDVQQMLKAMAVAAPLALAGAAGLGAWLARRSLKPLREASARARTARASDLDLTLPVGIHGDEWDDLARTLNSLLQEAHESIARIRAFTADAAHELRTPLTAMISDIDVTLRRERAPEELRAALAGVRTDAERLASVVEALLTLARADAGCLVERMALEPLEDVAREAAAQARAAAPGGEVQAAPRGEVRVEAEGAPMVRCERTLLVRALKNLIDNGLVHGGGRVTVRVLADGRVLVGDEGPGIDAALAPHLFERFRRGDAARSGKGIGLGLSLARTLVEAQGGTLRALAPARGAEFEVLLPLSANGAGAGPRGRERGTG